MPRTIRVLPIATTAVAAAALSVALGSSNALATVDPGTPGKDVHFGQDNDNASNPFIQPPGVNMTLHMDNTDVMFGRDNDDLLVGKKGSDTLLGGSGLDILIGGPDQGSAPVSDVMVGDKGDDVSIWSPRDGNDAFAGDEGEDTAIFAPLVTNRDGSLRLDSWESRTIPRVIIDRAGAFSCTLVNVPPKEQLGAQYIVRYTFNGAPVASVQLKDVEQVLCPSSEAGKVLVADLREPDPRLISADLQDVTGLAGAIIAPAS